MGNKTSILKCYRHPDVRDDQMDQVNGHMKDGEYPLVVSTRKYAMFSPFHAIPMLLVVFLYVIGIYLLEQGLIEYRQGGDVLEFVLIPCGIIFCAMLLTVWPFYYRRLARNTVVAVTNRRIIAQWGRKLADHPKEDIIKLNYMTEADGSGPFGFDLKPELWYERKVDLWSEIIFRGTFSASFPKVREVERYVRHTWYPGCRDDLISPDAIMDLPTEWKDRIAGFLDGEEKLLWAACPHENSSKDLDTSVCYLVTSKRAMVLRERTGKEILVSSYLTPRLKILKKEAEGPDCGSLILNYQISSHRNRRYQWPEGFLRVRNIAYVEKLLLELGKSCDRI